MPGTVVAWQTAARAIERPAKHEAPSGTPPQASGAPPVHDSVHSPQTQAPIPHSSLSVQRTSQSFSTDSLDAFSTDALDAVSTASFDSVSIVSSQPSSPAHKASDSSPPRYGSDSAEPPQPAANINDANKGATEGAMLDSPWRLIIQFFSPLPVEGFSQTRLTEHTF
jgi:hypothetical protein